MNQHKMLETVNLLLAIRVLNQAMSSSLHDDLPREVFAFLHTGCWLLIIPAIIHVYCNRGVVKADFLSGPGKGRG